VAGRIRDSIYKNHIMHIYAANETQKDLSLQEYEQSINDKVKTAKQDADKLNAVSEKLKDKVIRRISDYKDDYLSIEDGDIVVDENVAKWDIVKYKLINGIYSSQICMDKELSGSGFEIVESGQLNTPALKMDSKDITKRSFKETFEEYCQLKDNQPQFNLGRDIEIEKIEIYKPLVKEAYTVLGPEKVRELKYHQSNIKTEVIKKSKQNEDYKIMRLLQGKFPKQKEIPCREIKKELQKIYKELGIKRATKATDLSEWYEVKRVQKKIDGKNTDCMIIITPRITFGI